VQGEGAESGIADGIERLGRHPLDVIVVIRGGGSRTDLATFDAEPVARAIAGAPVPVLTGLGHEIDRSVADEVAHTALKTPTACAVALVQRVEAYRSEVEARWSAIAIRAAAVLDHADTALVRTARHASRRTAAAVVVAGQHLDHRAERVRREAGRVLAAAGSAIVRDAGRARAAAGRATDGAGRRLEVLEARARALDPAVTLARGWSITRRADGGVVRSIDDVEPGDELRTTVADGELRSRVEAAANDSGAEERPR
jgi:exodeoxyribonuclease VII large subunit